MITVSGSFIIMKQRKSSIKARFGHIGGNIGFKLKQSGVSTERPRMPSDQHSWALVGGLLM